MPRRALDGHCSGDLDGILAYGEGDSAALDELGADVGGVAHGCVGQAAEVTQRSSGSFVEQANGVGGEDLAVAANAGEARSEVVGGVVGRDRADA